MHLSLTSGMEKDDENNGIIATSLLSSFHRVSPCVDNHDIER